MVAETAEPEADASEANTKKPKEKKQRANKTDKKEKDASTGAQQMVYQKKKASEAVATEAVSEPTTQS